MRVRVRVRVRVHVVMLYAIHTSVHPCALADARWLFRARFNSVRQGTIPRPLGSDGDDDGGGRSCSRSCFRCQVS